MESKKKMSFFNELTVDLNDEAFFSSDIYERTRDNPNLNVSSSCHLWNDSLDQYANQLSEKMISVLRI